MNNLIVAAIMLILIFESCTQSPKKRSITAFNALMADTAAASCPYLTKDNKGNIVLSWVKHLDTSAAVYCYAVSHDHGKSFGKTVEIPASTNIYAHAENLPKIIFKPLGDILAVWGAANPNPKNAYSGIVYYSQSTDEGKTWSEAKKLVDDTTSFDQRYFDVALLPDGEAVIIWLDNRKKTSKEGAALYLAETKGNNGFKNERLISEPCCECCRTNLFIDSKKNIHVLYRAIINDSIRDMVHAVSTNRGKTFSAPRKISDDNWVINGCPHTGPAMAENGEGLQFTWFTAGTGTGVFYNNSRDNGKTFSKKDNLSSKTGRHPQITTADNGNISIVWDENFQKDKKYISRIGFQQTTSEGKDLIKDYITSDSSNSTYPVISSINNRLSIIAYTEKIKDKSHVVYKTVLIE